MAGADHVCICMGTYNGARFIKKQLRSFLEQTHENWSLLISDDGSNDETKDHINAFIAQNPQKTITLINGPKQDYSRNFLSLICHEKALGDFIAFSDQDDVWLPEKLAVGVQALAELSPDQPALFGSRTTIIDEDDQRIGTSPVMKKPTGFKNALVQNFAGGNTMLMNRTAQGLCQDVGPDLDIISHDWWVYLLVSGCGGTVLYHRDPVVLYRDHGSNLIGPNQGFWAKMHRLRLLFQNEYHNWNTRNQTALTKAHDLLTPDNQKIFQAFKDWRGQSGPKSLAVCYKNGFYRQTLPGTVSLYLAGFLGKI